MADDEKCLYIFRGIKNTCIVKGKELERYETSNGTFYKGLFKHKGMFGKTVDFKQIKELLIGQPKNLLIGDRKTMAGWKVIEINMDYETLEYNVADIPSVILSKITTLENEVEMYKKRSIDAENRLLTIESKDRLNEKMNKDLKMIGDLKTIATGFGGGYDNSMMMGRWGLGGFGSSNPMPPNQE